MPKFLPIILIIIAAAAGLGFYLLGTGPSGFTGSLKDALALGKALKCVWEEEGSSGTVYIKGEEKVYTEITTAEGTGYLISINNCLYSWDKGNPQGAKLCFTPAEGEETVGFTDMAAEAEVNLEDDITYNCEDTTLNDSLFSPPPNVEFVEVKF